MNICLLEQLPYIVPLFNHLFRHHLERTGILRGLMRRPPHFSIRPLANHLVQLEILHIPPGDSMLAKRANQGDHGGVVVDEPERPVARVIGSEVLENLGGVKGSGRRGRGACDVGRRVGLSS